MVYSPKDDKNFQKIKSTQKEEWDQYFTPKKIIRDLTHGYVRLTKFELEIIDKAPFQRLKDIRQLTCQQVYPAARHTRFEHSLGVMELTRRAIDSLNENGFLTNGRKYSTNDPPISDFIRFNVTLAALLHDVGHCPFSHLGETQFDPLEVWRRLRKDVHHFLGGSELDQRFQEKKYDKKPDKGAVHEHLSCIVVLESFYDMFKAVSIDNKKGTEGSDGKIRVDLELLLRCILGIEYDVKTSRLLQDSMEKNAAIRLINSTIFDMDKLDYIMRDSLFTGIGVPTIDTDRLFRNMHLSEQYSLVFTSKAVPVLQNMIEARDNLYMYVYNHHTAVFSDFIFSYIQRRMDHNARAFYKIMYPSLFPTEFSFVQMGLAEFPVSRQGLVLKPYLFSSDAVVEGNRSDSDWISLVNVIYIASKQNRNTDYISIGIEAAIEEERADLVVPPGGRKQCKHFSWSKYGKKAERHCERFVPWHNPSEEDCGKLAKQIKRTYSLVDRYQSRKFLKPWWKTIFEFQNFMSRNFYDDNIRKQLCDFIYKDGEYGLPAAEFRSQLAKHVKYVTQRLYKENAFRMFLNDDDLFVVERSIRFFDQNTIEKLDIALQTNEIVGVPIETVNKDSPRGYYIKNLTSIIPQKDYSSLYGERSFYVYSRDFSHDVEVKNYSPEEVQKFNRVVEQIFVFTAEELIRRGEQDFVERFCRGTSEAENLSMNDIFTRYCKKEERTNEKN